MWEWCHCDEKNTNTAPPPPQKKTQTPTKQKTNQKPLKKHHHPENGDAKTLALNYSSYFTEAFL